MLITMDHIRAAGGCAWGLRAFFTRYHLDLQAFIRDEGIAEELLLATGNELALRAVRLAHEQEADRGQ